MKEKDKFRYAEKCLYEYKQNLACLDILREDLRAEQSGLDVHAQNYDSVPMFAGTPSNPVQSRILRIEQIEGRIKKLERWTKPVGQMIENLKGANNEVLMRILKLMYFGQNPPDVVIRELKIARRTFYYHRRKLVDRVIDYLAL